MITFKNIKNRFINEKFKRKNKLPTEGQGQW